MATTIDWYYRRGGRTGCRRSDAVIAARGATVRETVKASATKVRADDLPALFDGATRVLVGRGNSYVTLDPRRDPTGDVAAHVLGRSEGVPIENARASSFAEPADKAGPRTRLMTESSSGQGAVRGPHGRAAGGRATCDCEPLRRCNQRFDRNSRDWCRISHGNTLSETLRAPTTRIGSTWVVGFTAGMWNEILT